jgi:hypothetical protein
MAMEIGAGLGNMQEAWWMPAFRVPGELYDGQPLGRMTLAERTLPGSIMVNQDGGGSLTRPPITTRSVTSSTSTTRSHVGGPTIRRG